MKILMCADTFGGPTATFIHNDFEYMSKKHDVFFLCIKRLGFRNTKLQNIKKIKYKRNLIQRILSRLDLSLNYKNKEYAQELNTFIKTFSPNVIHCNFGIEALKIIDNLENKTIPIIIQFRGYDASSSLKSKSYIKRLKSVLSEKRIHPIFVSESLRNNLINAGIQVNKSSILYSGINLKKFVLRDKEKTLGEKTVFLQVSSLVEKKGHEYTIKAFSRFLEDKDKDKYELVLTGEGPRRRILEKLVKNLDIENNVEFVGYVKPERAIELMKRSHVFVHHSIISKNGDQEGIPNALMEAMAMELPVLSTKHSGIPELVQDGENGFLVDEKNIQLYTERMNEIIKWKTVPENRIVIENKFEMTIHNKKLESIYISILKCL